MNKLNRGRSKLGNEACIGVRARIDYNYFSNLSMSYK